MTTESNPIKKSAKKTCVNPAAIVADWNNGKQLTQLAQEHGCKIGVIRYALKKAEALGLGVPRRGMFTPPEEPCPMAALLWPEQYPENV
jgi:hypothetical protein